MLGKGTEPYVNRKQGEVCVAREEEVARGDGVRNVR
jgi:hypothetical protein